MIFSTSKELPAGRWPAAALLLSVLAVAVQPASAQTVKKWVDEEGVTHYSDQLPTEGEAEVREVEIEKAPITESESQEVNERLEKQLRELEQAREAREQEREAAERARDLEEALEREPVIESEKKKKKDRDRPYSGPYPKPPPGPFPEQYPRARDSRGNAEPPPPSNQEN